ncbi:MAG: hypothetical protein ACPG5T_02450 [Endozoicomonas sp.]
MKDQLPGLAVHGIEELLDLSSGVSSAEVMPSLRLLFPLMAYFEPFLNQMLPGVQYLQLFMTDTENTFLLLLSTDGKECFDICFFEGAGVMISDQSCVKKMTEFSVLLALMATINRKKNGRGQFYFLGRMRYLDEKLSLAMSVQDIITICGASSYGGVQSTTSEEVEVFTDVDLGCEPFWGEVCQETTSSIVDVYFVKGRGSAEAVRINRDKRAVYNAQLSRLISQLGSPVRGWTSLSSLKAFSFFKMSRLPVGHLVLVENEHLLEGFLANKDWTEEERDQITRLHLANCGYYTVTETLGLDIDKRDAAVVNLKAEELRMEIYIHLLRRLIQQDCDQRGTESTIGETSSAFGGGAAGR